MTKRLTALLALLCLLLAGCTRTQADPTVPETAVAAAAATEETLPTQPEEAPYLRVHFIDVGQADSMLLESGGEFMIIDAGTQDTGEFLVSYLKRQGVEELKYVLCTHGHYDHVGGMAAVLNAFPAEAVYCNTESYPSTLFTRFVKAAQKQGLELQIPELGDTLTLGDAVITVLGPARDYDFYEDINDTSIVVRVDFGKTSLMLTGDMEEIGEVEMLNYWDDDSIFQADVLKLGHHGSDSSSKSRFLKAVDPDYTVAMVGADNPYDHPQPPTLQRLRQAGIPLLRTDQMGTIVAESDGEKFTFSWGKWASAPTPAVVFLGDVHTRQYHVTGCLELPAEKDRIQFETISVAQAGGYSPCTICIG